MRIGPRAGTGYAATLLLGVALGLCAPLGAQARVSVLPLQGLRFGSLSPGIPAVISPGDGARAATFDLVGSGTVTLRVSVPASLEQDGGSALPVRFGPGDGRVVFSTSAPDLVFDPSRPLSFAIPAGTPGVKVYLGGSLAPGLRQVPGAYDAAIEVEVLSATLSS